MRRERMVKVTVKAALALALALAAAKPAVAGEPVTYTDARGVQHTTSNPDQIACERDRGGHWSLSGACEGERPLPAAATPGAGAAYLPWVPAPGGPTSSPGPASPSGSTPPTRSPTTRSW